MPAVTLSSVDAGFIRKADIVSSEKCDSEIAVDVAAIGL
jgi:hypothetical protein